MRRELFPLENQFAILRTDFDWDHSFGKLGVRWLHTGGIFATPGDTSMASKDEVEKLMKGGGARVQH